MTHDTAIIAIDTVSQQDVQIPSKPNLPSGPVVSSTLCIIIPLSPEMTSRREASFNWNRPTGLGAAKAKGKEFISI